MLRRLAGLDGSQGTSSDNEVAVAATAGAESFGRRDEPGPGPTACVEVELHKSLPERGWQLQDGPRDDRGTGADGLQRCRVDVVVVVEAGAESVSGCSGRPPNTGPTAGSSGKERPTVVRVRRAVTRSVV